MLHGLLLLTRLLPAVIALPSLERRGGVGLGQRVAVEGAGGGESELSGPVSVDDAFKKAVKKRQWKIDERQ